MPDSRFILSIDQGTSGTKTVIIDGGGNIIAKGSEPLKTFYLDYGFVEQDPESIYQNVLASVKKCLAEFAKSGKSQQLIKVVGISNQRETFVVWDENGQPLHNAVVWQCKRSIGICDELRKQGLENTVRSKTGLLIDPYFSGTKLIWLYQNVEKVRTAIDNGNAYFGTVDTWLLFKLTGGKSYLTDFTNASRTLFFNLATLSWDRELLATFGLSNLRLPKCQPSSSFYAATDLNGLLENPVDITAMIGDSHAAAFGEGCYAPGMAKATLGTGCSILMNVGSKVKQSSSGMVSTICWSSDKETQYALEGVIVTCGATIEWLKNEVGLFADSRETEAMANSVKDNNGVYLVPAFSGLGAPHWDMSRKASIVGLTFGATKNHIVRAALESIAYQIKDVVVAMERDTNLSLDILMVDGGISSNGFVMQFLADLLDKNVVNIGETDVSALGAGYLAAIKWDIPGVRSQRVYKPANDARMNEFYQGWKNTLNKI